VVRLLTWRRVALVAILSAALVLVANEPLRMLADSLMMRDGVPSPGTLKVNFGVDKELVASGFQLPVYLSHAGDGSGRLFVLEKPGKMRIIKDGEVLPRPFLDITPIVRSSGYEQGFLSFAFHPKYRDNGYFFVSYNDLKGDTVIARYQVSAGNPDLADPNTAKQLLWIDQPFPNHNGGLIKFGPDGYLYIGMGDGGGAGDPLRAGQDLKTLLGKILRLDVDQGNPYAIPADNPFANGREGAPEIWTYGWRNPWRFSFDRVTGDMYIGDVGQNAIEEISFQPAGIGGLNYGWFIMEGSQCYPARANCNKNGLILPIAEYNHRFGNSVTGGYVYRGTAFPEMAGTYFYADFGSSRLWALQQTQPGTFESAEMGMLNIGVSSFGEDEAGELYVLDYFEGGVYRLVVKAG
jgi:glucose/arabinose dehydrogenase